MEMARTDQNARAARATPTQTDISINYGILVFAARLKRTEMHPTAGDVIRAYRYG
jgi:hypothetical protein